MRQPRRFCSESPQHPAQTRKWRDIGRLKAKILCTSHNSSLSPYDDEGLAMCKAAKSTYDADNTGDMTIDTFTIDGNRLERWMLKTLIGGLYSGKVWTDLAAMEAKPPPDEWLEILYGRRDFPDRQGLYWQPTALAGLDFDHRDEFEVLPWMSDQTVIGLHVWFYSFHIALLAANVAPGSVSGEYRPADFELAAATSLSVQLGEWPRVPGHRRRVLSPGIRAEFSHMARGWTEASCASTWPNCTVMTARLLP